MRRQSSVVDSNRAGEASTVTIRRTSSASPSTRSTSGPGSAFQGSWFSRCALASRIRRQVASSALGGDVSAQAADASATTSAASGASTLSGSGAGPTPSHFLATTVATRAARLPRLLARSVL